METNDGVSIGTLLRRGKMEDNMNVYNEARKVPNKAQKTIKGGRLSGMTDINPMWRIKKLTELFGACGFGWKYEIADKRLEEGANGEIAAFVDINLYVKKDDEWSEPIQGTGGSTFVAKERKGLYMSDECFKMALTDAISVACKSLGFGADVYWDKDTTKYSNQKNNKQRNYAETILKLYASNKDKVKPVLFEYYKKNNMKIKSPKDVKKLNKQKSLELLKEIKEVV